MSETGLAEQLLRDVEEVLARKQKDYGGYGDRLFNFRFVAHTLQAALGQGMRADHLPYLAFLQAKIARLITLVGHGGTPANEAVEDTIRDLIGYAALWGEYIGGDA